MWILESSESSEAHAYRSRQSEAQTVSVFRFLTIALVLYAGALAAEPIPLSGDAGGATCHYYMLAGKLAWKRQLGDWADVSGEPYGEKAYAAEELRGTREGTPVSFDVSALAREWLTAAHPNTGVFLRGTSGGGSIAFHSRESVDLESRPFLDLVWADGSRERLAPVSDTFLDCTTNRSSGAGRLLRVGRDQTTLVVFDLPQQRGRKLAAAHLGLHVAKQYAHALTVGVFRPVPVWAATKVVVEDGLAARFPGDRNIATHPDVILALTFETPDWQREWKRLSPSRTHEMVGDDENNDFKPLDGAALKATLKKGKNNALNLSYPFARAGKEPEEIYFRYYLRFGEDWSPDVEGGKLPGIAGTYGKGGWGMRRSDGKNGWSARGAFWRTATVPDGGTVTPVGSYVYHADVGDAGTHWGWNRGPTGLMRNNRWYAIEQYVKLNTPGERNGVFRAWVDGQLAYERDGLRFRDLDSIKIESIWLNVYHGGRAKSPRDMSLYIDNLVIAKRYIGPRVP
ncbi:polysaccharide lyase [Aromatoleum buckelii]|uniref:Polysaccharide lyase 14 domain-containing protein n=1 Tax=Aromatoleum buckelii TaxID=200254 RepID=A0ABX1N2U0_9RHOO|nr:hypothetical protein [Aromatoleum buckelii]MCK0510744.1 hypothetical protein [Aromatoleum buckelii]